MAEDNKTNQTEPPAAQPASKGSMATKLLVFGIPVFLVQLVLVYFLTAKFVVPIAVQHHAGNDRVAAADHGASRDSNSGDSEATQADAKEQHIYVVKDLIINPAGTNGQRYLLTTIAFNVNSEEALKGLEKKEMAVRDMLNSILTSKSMEQLIDVSKREPLRQEIADQAKEMIQGGRLLSVYFSKYIIQ
jgi:flagellar FliL protein